MNTAIQAERRAHPRFEVSIPGWVYLDAGREQIRCRLVDLSMGGARIVLMPWRLLPSTVQLLELRDGNTFDCQVRWQNADAAGLHFVDVCSTAARRKLLEKARGSGFDASPRVGPLAIMEQPR